MKVAVILPAAGLGTRMAKGSAEPLAGPPVVPAEKTGTSRKQFMLLDGSPILMHTVRKFLASDRVGAIVIAVRAEDTGWVREMVAQAVQDGRVRVVEGGNSRQESVENALASLGPEYELVAVHDAVRPFIDLATIHKVFDEAAASGAAIVAVPAVDTVKQVTREATHVHVRATLPREKLVMAQTPQVFRYELLLRAFQAARQDGFIGTDESSMVERLDIEVSVVPGSDRNIKITKPTDMELAHLFLREETRSAHS
jgi:2-C-methyl-D-erythritol 4-phosphate cytidylyltransferase